MTSSFRTCVSPDFTSKIQDLKKMHNLQPVKIGEKMYEWKGLNSDARKDCGLSPLVFNI